MMNKKAFTLMELLVAIFIGSMVTIALVSVWKGASLQTSQSQRQTVIRNNLSIFLRMIHRDITDSDIIIFPRTDGQSSGNLVLVAIKNGYRDEKTFTARTHTDTLSSYPKAIVYCYTKNKVLRSEKDLAEGTTQVISDYINALGCSGQNVMDFVTGIKVTTKDAINYKLQLQVKKDFADKTTPINLEFEQIFVISGGG